MLTGRKGLALLGTLGFLFWVSVNSAGADIRKRFIVADCQSRQPIAGAKIKALNAAVSAGSASQAVTGAEGFAEIFPLRFEGSHQFQVSAGGYSVKMTSPGQFKANTTVQTSVCLDRVASKDNASPSASEGSESPAAQSAEQAAQTTGEEETSDQNAGIAEASGTEENATPPIPSSESFRKGTENRAKAHLESPSSAVPYGSSTSENNDEETENAIHQVAQLLQNTQNEGGAAGENQGASSARKTVTSSPSGKLYLLTGFPAPEKDDDGDDPRDTPPPTTYGEEIDTEGITIQVQFFTARYNKGRRLRFKPKWVKAVKWWAKRINKKCETLQIDKVEVLEDDTTALNRTAEELEAFEMRTRGKRRVMARKIRRKKKAAKWPKKVHGLFHFATQDQFVDRRSPRRHWLIGKGPLIARIGKNRSTRTFNIGLFRFVKVTPRGKDGTGAVPGIFFSPNVLAARANALSQGSRARIHEIGHMYGLVHPDGGIMKKSYAKGSGGWYGSPKYWGAHWCDKIAGHLGA